MDLKDDGDNLRSLWELMRMAQLDKQERQQ